MGLTIVLFKGFKITVFLKWFLIIGVAAYGVLAYTIGIDKLKSVFFNGLSKDIFMIFAASFSGALYLTYWKGNKSKFIHFKK